MEEEIPLRRRRLVAVAVDLYARSGELEALEWEDVDLEHGTIHIHRAMDRQRDVTKTSVPRRVPIETTSPPLQVMHDENGGAGRVLDMPQVDDLMARLIEQLEAQRAPKDFGGHSS